MSKVFISGSISIKSLPDLVKESIKKIMQNNIIILIGDADGIDTLVQDYCISENYYNVTVYSIFSFPRYIASDKFNKKHIIVTSEIKKERARQQEKDKAMTFDSEYTFVIWDSKSKGSYSNILRALDNAKKTKVFLNEKNAFLDQKQTNKVEVEFIYRQHNGYTASEIVEYLKNEFDDRFQRTQDLNKYLLESMIIKREDNIYKPNSQYENLFIVEKYRGKPKGIKFKNEFIDWIETQLKDEKKFQQSSLFDV